MIRHWKVVVALILLWLPILANATTLVYTAPCFTLHRWKIWDEQKAESVMTMDCNAGPDSLRETLKIYLWKRVIAPGTQFVRFDSHYVAPCREDSFINQGPGHYYVTARNSAGELCGSNQATILPLVMTGVEEAVDFRKVEREVFDVHGRRVRCCDDLPSGVYWVRERRGKAVTVKKMVILKGGSK